MILGDDLIISFGTTQAEGKKIEFANFRAIRNGRLAMVDIKCPKFWYDMTIGERAFIESQARIALGVPVV